MEDGSKAYRLPLVFVKRLSLAEISRFDGTTVAQLAFVQTACLPWNQEVAASTPGV